MLGYWILYIAVTVLVKLALGLAAIYLLLPADGRCPACDRDTIAVTDLPALGWLFRAARVQRRWCTGCARPCLARRARAMVVWVRAEDDAETAPLA